MQRPVILLSGLPPDLPDGFIRRAYRPSDRPALPTALPEALAAGSPGSSLPPTLPTGFVSQTFRPPDRQTYRMVSYVGLTDRQTGLPYRQPYLKLSPQGHMGHPYRMVLYARLTGRFRSSGQTGQPYRQPHRPATLASPTDQPNRPAQPASPTGSQTGSPTDQPDRPTRPATRPAILTGHPHRPSTPAKVAPSPLTGRLRSAGRRLRGWRSSRHG